MKDFLNLFSVLLLIGLAVFGHYHSWGFWVYVCVFAAGIIAGQPSKGWHRMHLSESEKSVLNRPEP